MAKLKKVCPENFDVEALMMAAREGRLYIDESKKNVSNETVKKSVRTYVNRIKGCVTTKYQGMINSIWEKILCTDEFLELLRPSSSSRDDRKFNTYNLMRIIGILRDNDVYQSYSQRKYNSLLEQTTQDSPYRRYLGMGFEDHSLLIKLKKIIDDAKL